MEKQGFKTTSQYFKSAGIIWLILSILISILGYFQILNFVFNKSDVLWYGKLQPILNNTLIFGSILSFFFGAIFDEIDQLDVNLIKPSFIGYITFSIHQIALVFGIIVIMMGYNQGRSYGELDFISDNLFMLVYTIVIVLTLVYTFNLESINGSIQMILITLAGIITTYFLGNFGFPNSYITNVPPTSGYQDAMVTSFYKTSIFVFYISLPLIYTIYSSVKKAYKFDDKNENYTLPLILIVILVSISAGVGLGTSSYSNFWTIIGNYVFSSINILLMGFIYIFHGIYKSLKEKKSIFLITVSGTLISILFFYNFVLSLPILYNNLQYTSSDPFIFVNKVIYILLPVYLLYLLVSNQNNYESIPSWIPMLLLISGIVALLSFLVEGIFVSKAINDIANNELVNKEWGNILSKNTIFHYIQIVLHIIYFVISFYMISLSVKDKQAQIQEKNIA